MTVLLTGASGFVGAAVLRRLLDAGCKVRALVRAGSDRRNLDGLDVEIVVGDLTDPTTLRAALDGCEGLFHVAADYRLWVRDPARMFAVNVAGTRDLMLAALDAGVRRIVYTSSVATLGIDSSGADADEESPVTFEDMVGPYKRSKFLAEVEVQRLIAAKRLPAVIVNPSTPVGPRDIKPTPTGRMIVEAASGRMPAFVDTGLNVVHVQDVADGHLMAYEMGTVGERYILGGENMPLSEILAEIARITGRKPPKIRVPHCAVMPIAAVSELWCRAVGGAPFVTMDGVRMARKRMYFTSDKAGRSFGYSPRPARDALRDAVASFRESGHFI
jgi:dihydroflavonol-4-reductase